MKQRILSILVDNTAGVLGRIAGMFSRRGYNIDSLTVGVTADPRYSRMTVVCSGDDDPSQGLLIDDKEALIFIKDYQSVSLDFLVQPKVLSSLPSPRKPIV